MLRTINLPDGRVAIGDDKGEDRIEILVAFDPDNKHHAIAICDALQAYVNAQDFTEPDDGRRGLRGYTEDALTKIKAALNVSW